MIQLTTRGTAVGIREPLVCKVICDTSKDTHWPSRAVVLREEPSPSAIRDACAALCEPALTSDVAEAMGVPLIHSVPVSHLQQGDVVSLEPNGTVRTLYRRASKHNTLFATERCNSFCVMCSQPPKEIDDRWRIEEMLRTVELIDPEASEIGISGGEPTLLGDGLISVIQAAKDRLPSTALHILSNGRLFRYDALAQDVADVKHPDVMFGIPLYSDLDFEHDHVVQARGAFEDTVLGLQNLARVGVPIEIRVVIHKMTYKRLEALGEFIYRNLTFASHVTFMGLEATGFAKGNMGALWIDPADYRETLERATLFLAKRGMRVSVYNHQLCVVSPSIWPYCRQAISDWKNEYHRVCNDCAVRSDCGGFFMFNLKDRTSRELAAIAPSDPRIAGRPGVVPLPL